MSYKLAIFDLDGTLLNTIRDLADSVNYALEKNGFPKRTLEEVTKFVGNGIRKLIVRAVPKGTDEHMTDVVFEDFKEYYGKHCADKTEKYPGIDYVLDSLHKERCRTAVISNKADYAVKILCDVFSRVNLMLYMVSVKAWESKKSLTRRQFLLFLTNLKQTEKMRFISVIPKLILQQQKMQELME